MKHPVNMTKEEWKKFYPVQRIDDRVYCVDCERGVCCPDWDPPDGWCTAGVRSSKEGELK